MNHPLNHYIDHTLLKPEATSEEIKYLCREGMEYQFATVCVQPFWALIAAQLLSGSPVKVCSVVGFPLGLNTSDIKAKEASALVQMGVEEVDMVLNIGALKSQQWEFVKKDIEEVVKASGPANVKVILETCLLTDEEKHIAAKLAVEGGAAFVKTSTGFSKGGATVADVALLRKVVGPHIGVKASGGVRDLPTALAMIAAGATRIGTSSGVKIMKEAQGNES